LIVMGLREYVEVTKPRIWSLLVYTGVAGYLIASGGSIDTRLLILTVALILGTGGANTLTGYIDRDIDAVMKRTMKRPIPSGRLDPGNALYYGLLLSIGSISLALMLNPLCGVLMAIGLFDNVVVYSLWSKRRTPLNIILGAPSGGVPTLIGYAAYDATLPLDAWLLFLLVVIWTPLHIWTLALVYREDYLRAGVPMYTSILDEDRSIKVIGVSALALALSSLLLPLAGGIYTHPVFLGTLAGLNLLVLYYSYRVVRSPNMRDVWTLFKITSPYLFVVYTVAAILASL